MENITRELIDQAYAKNEKILLVHWSRPSQQHPSTNYTCWEVNTYFGAGRDGCTYLGKGERWDEDAVPLDAPIEKIFWAALAAHDNSFYSKGTPVATVIVEHPTLPGVVAVFDVAAFRTRHFEIRWDTYGSHGAHSSGTVGKFQTRQEAEEELNRQRRPGDGEWNSQGVATDWRVIAVTTDGYGNRTEESV